MQAVPFNLNGLITPTPLKLFKADVIADLKTAFVRCRAARVLLNLPDNDVLQLNEDVFAWQLHSYRRNIGAKTLATTLAPMRAVAQACSLWGAQPIKTTVRITSGYVRKARVQVEGAQLMHTDVSAILYKRDLDQDRITLRGLLPTSMGPIVCDHSGELDPIPLLTFIGGDKFAREGERCQAEGRTSVIGDGELMLMDQLTLHAARPLLAGKDRVLVDCAVTMQMPKHWRHRVRDGDVPRFKL